MQERFLEDKQGSWCTPEAYLKATKVSLLPEALGGSGHTVRQGHKGKVPGLWAHLSWVVVAKAKEDN